MHIGYNRLAIQWEVVKPGMVEMETEIETEIETDMCSTKDLISTATATLRSSHSAVQPLCGPATLRSSHSAVQPLCGPATLRSSHSAVQPLCGPATLRSALQVNDSTKCGLYYSNALTMSSKVFHS